MNESYQENSPSIQSPTFQPYRLSELEAGVLKREGVLYKRSDHLKRWRKRFVTCENNFLKTAHDQQGKEQKIIDLNEYTLTWKGKSKDKYVLAFKLRAGVKRQTKEVVLGSKDEGVAKDWLKFFISVMDTTNLPVHLLQLANDNRLSTQPDRSLYRSQTKETGGGVGKGDESIIVLQQDKKRAVSLGVKNEPEQKQLSDESVGTEMDNNTRTLDNPDNADNAKGAEEAKQDISLIIENTKTTQSDIESSIVSVPKLVEKKEKVEAVERRVEKSKEYSLPKEAPKWVEQLFREHIQGKSSWKAPMQEKIDKSIWNMLEDNGRIRILQSYKETTVFKCLYALEGGVSAEKLLQVLLDVQNKDKWDNSFEKATMLSYLHNTKESVIHQVNKAFGMLYFPREFIYRRYIFKTLNTYFIVDQSIDEPQEVQKSLKCPRGHIDYSSKVMHIANNDGYVCLNVLLSMTNGGLVSSGQDRQITLHSLMNLSSINSVFNQYEEWDEFELAFLPTTDESSQYSDAETVEIKVPASLVSNSQEVDFSRVLQQQQQNQNSETVNTQSALDGSNDDTDMEKDKLQFEEESKIDSTFDIPVSPISKQDQRFIPESLSSLLEKVKNQIVTVECIDKRVPEVKLSTEELGAIITDEENEIMIGKLWVKELSTGLRFTDEEYVNKQKNVLGHLLKSMGKNLFEGKSIMNISMPVTVFADESMLRRCCKVFGYAPSLLTMAGQEKNPVEAFNYAVAFFLSTLHLAIEQTKPFNPILGETYQGYIGGIPILSEQISHHPPITSIYMKTEDFFLYGNIHLEVSLGPNSATAVHRRRLCLFLPKLNMNVYVYFPLAFLTGTAFGKRYINWTKKMKVYETTHNLYCEMNLNPDDKGVISNMFAKKNFSADKLRGNMYRVKPEYMKVFHKKEETVNTDPRAKFNPKEHAVEELGTLEGSWITHLDINGKRIWDTAQMKPYKIIDKPNKNLPSDYSLREDIIYMKMKDLKKSQEAKDFLENLQRADRKARERFSKTKH